MSNYLHDWRQSLLHKGATIGHAIQSLNKSAMKIILVVNEGGRLEGTISDGDIRRGLLKGLDIASPVDSIINRNALVAPPEISREMVKQLMMVNKVQQIPAVDENHCVVGLHLWDEIISPPERPNPMIIMAGGKGVRLRPYTENCPKPLLPVAGKPILEHIIDRARSEGFFNFVIATHYLGQMIKDYFKSGDKWNVRIDYLNETSPLGTAGALSLLNPVPQLPFIVTNGDVITDIRYGELLDFHARHGAIATMAVRAHEWQHPFGVVRTKGIEIIEIEEKPISRTYINAGVYALAPETLEFLHPNKPCDMPHLFDCFRDGNRSTVAYPMHEPWLDVGKPDDLLAANKI